MKLKDFDLLADENIDAEVVEYLRSLGFQVVTVAELELYGAADTDLLRRSVTENRIVVTHDADFGVLAVANGEPVVGILFLRPGHIDPEFTTGTIRAVLARDPDVTPPFLVVARRAGLDVVIRYRPLAVT